MNRKELKPHWQRLINIVEGMENGEILHLKFQGGLPMKLGEIKGERRDVDLTRGERDEKDNT